MEKTRVVLRKKNHLLNIKKLFRNDFFVSYSDNFVLFGSKMLPKKISKENQTKLKLPKKRTKSKVPIFKINYL